MGAGIPREIPAVLDAFAGHLPATIKFDIEGGTSSDAERLSFDPRAAGADPTTPLKRPLFFPIVASTSLAATLAKKASGRVDGFVVEGHTSGGHNAPPRGELRFNERGEPIYGERDVVDLTRISELGVPFWIAGGAGSPERLQKAVASGATGVQVGTLFAYCDESGLAPAIKREVLSLAVRCEIEVVTDPRASPTGYPFKIVHWEGSDAESVARTRKCDLGYLRVAYRGTDGRIGYRCPAEPVDAYVNKGGAIEDTEGRRCLCNGLVANIGYPQSTPGGADEPPLITSGDDLMNIASFLGSRTTYTAGDVIDYLLGTPPPSRASSPPPNEINVS
jgi:NAD(P)H-dependent flavin oxidoreductase YrpB (nitropropane dioxygenase family)